MSTASILQDQQRKTVDTRSLADRIHGVLKHFGLPRWVKGPHAPDAKLALTVRSRGYKTETVEEALRVTGDISRLPAPAFVVGIKSRGVGLDRPATETNLLDRIEISELAKPAVTSTKSRILKWMESPFDKIVSLADIKAAFSDVAPSGVSSRVSELVKSGDLVACLKGNKANLKHTVYWLPKEPSEIVQG